MTALTQGLILALACTVGQPVVEREEDEFSGVLNERNRAQARYEVSQTAVEQLARERRQAVENGWQARYEEFLAGRGTLDTLLEWKQRLAIAKSPLPKTVETPRPVLEDLWTFTWHAHTLTAARYEAARTTAADYFQSLYELRQVEVQLALTRAKK